MIDMPYFDWLLRYAHEAPNSDIVKALATRYTHWGYFDHPDQEHVSTVDFLYAAERLTDRVIALARIQDGATVLDVGCGFGGTVARINERFSSMTVTGLNIDARQIERARTLVAARSGNRIEFIQGDACDMPLPEGTFDSVLALECVSHFPSRRRFMLQARRVLKPGGRLAICDFVPYGPMLPLLIPLMAVFQAPIRRWYGYTNKTLITKRLYQALARHTGFRMIEDEDITKNTRPTVSVFLRWANEGQAPAGRTVTQVMQRLSAWGMVRYRTTAFLAV